jgi:hypothetical protein
MIPNVQDIVILWNYLCVIGAGSRKIGDHSIKHIPSHQYHIVILQRSFFLASLPSMQYLPCNAASALKN